MWIKLGLTFASIVALVSNYDCGVLADMLGGGADEIEILSIENCDAKGEGYDLKFEVKEIDGENFLSASMTLNEDVSSDFTFDLVFDKYSVTGILEEGIYKVEKADLCDYAERFTGEAYAKAAAASVPPMNPECPINAGTYKIENLKLIASDVDLPDVIKGHFRATLKIYDPAAKLAGCQQIELILT